MKYTVAEFKKNTRKILNEALDHPVTITRYDDEFVITAAANLNTPKRLISDLPIETRPDVIDNVAYMFKEKDIKIGKVVKLLAVNPVPITSIPHLEDVRENINNNQLKAAAKSYCKHGQQKGNCLAKDNKDCNK